MFYRVPLSQELWDQDCAEFVSDGEILQFGSTKFIANHAEIVGLTVETASTAVPSAKRQKASVIDFFKPRAQELENADSHFPVLEEASAVIEAMPLPKYSHPGKPAPGGNWRQALFNLRDKPESHKISILVNHDEYALVYDGFPKAPLRSDLTRRII